MSQPGNPLATITGPAWLDFAVVADAIRRLAAEGEPIDCVTVAAELKLPDEPRSKLVRRYLFGTWRLWAPDEEHS